MITLSDAIDQLVAQVEDDPRGEKGQEELSYDQLLTEKELWQQLAETWKAYFDEELQAHSQTADELIKLRKEQLRASH